MKLDDQEFIYPDDFMNEVEEVEAVLPPLRHKASTILYLVSVVLLLVAVILPLVDTAGRHAKSDQPLIQSVEWNGFSQIGLFLGVESILLFLLGREVDRRGA